MPYTDFGDPPPGPVGFLHISPDSDEILFTEVFDFKGETGLSPLMAFHITTEAYWMLGPISAVGVNKLIQIDRNTLEVVETFVVPGPTG